MKKKKRKHKSDPEFQKLVEELWEKDVDRVDESGSLKSIFSEILILLSYYTKLARKTWEEASKGHLARSVGLFK